MHFLPSNISQNQDDLRMSSEKGNPVQEMDQLSLNQETFLNLVHFLLKIVAKEGPYHHNSAESGNFPIGLYLTMYSHLLK